MTEAVLAPIVLGWLIACHALISKPRSVPIALLAGLLAGLAYLMHVRGVVIAALHLLLLLFLLVRRPRLRPAAAFISAGALVGAVVFNELVIHLLGDSMYVSGVAPGSSMAEKLATTRGVAKIVMSAAGQLWYLAIAGFGITALGMLTVPRWLRKGPGRDRPTGITMVLALLATLGIALMSAAVLQGISMRMNYLAYPRYVHVLEPWWLLTGIAALAAPVRRKYLAPALAVLLTGAIGVLVWYRMTRGAMHGFYTFDSPELSILTNGWTRLRPVVATLVGILMIVLVVWLVGRARSRRRALLWLAGVLVAANLIMVPIAVEFVSVPMMGKTASQPSLAEMGVREGDTVVVESATVWWQHRNTEREVTWARVSTFRLNGQAPPRDTTVVIARFRPGDETHWNGELYGFHLIGANIDNEWAAWRRNTPTS
jgi:hypothetical protein